LLLLLLLLLLGLPWAGFAALCAFFPAGLEVRLAGVEPANWR
jgi:hypothetical protein